MVALALHDAGGEARGRVRTAIGREEAHVADEDTADIWIVLRAYGYMAANQGSHFLGARCPVRLAEQVPRLGETHGCEVAVEPTTHHSVVRGVGLEEEGLANREHVETTSTSGPPEVNFGEVWAGREEVIPVVVGHPDVTSHRGIMYPAGVVVP